jgi:hypothetical protein
MHAETTKGTRPFVNLAARQVYVVLSPRSLGYAKYAIESLFQHSVESINLHLITDSPDDKRALEDAVNALDPAPRHAWSVASEEDLNDAEADRFARLPNLRILRHGHPCWRKVTDPLLIGAPGEELVLLDPDVYFPNHFKFEETPATGLCVMFQQPNCLLPPENVRAMLDAGIKLARHVDIGVSNWRTGSDLEWIDWMIGKLGKLGAPLPRVMHIEAIVWSAIAMREGGFYLDPALWVCWRRSQLRRVRLKLGTKSDAILDAEPWATMKCFHGGGEAKWWVPDYVAGHLATTGKQVLQPGRKRPYVELTRSRYEMEQKAKGLVYTLGYNRILGAKY